MDESLQATIVAVEQGEIVLQIGKQQLRWPRHMLAEEPVIGGQVSVQVLTSGQSAQQDEHRARRLLAEILGHQL